MPNQYSKPAGLKYTDMCIYIDANLDKIVKTGEYPAVESRIYEYLYHIVYALALKGNFFSKNFEDYNNFALFGATELFLSIKKKQLNAGKEFRGKIVEPVKSCLNFIKRVLFPLKVEYGKRNFIQIYNPDTGQDTAVMSQDMRDSIQAFYRRSLQEDLEELIDKIPDIFSQIIHKTPYKKDPIMVSRLILSCKLTFLNDIVFSKKSSIKAKKYLQTRNDIRLIQSYQSNLGEVVLWHLPSTLANYVRLLVTIAKQKMSDELEETRAATDLSEKVIDDILDSAYPNYDMRDEEE